MAGLKAKEREGGVWYAVGSIRGQRIRQSLGTRDKGRAIELCALLEARLWKRHSYGEEAVRTFEEAAVRYTEANGEARYLPPLMKRFRERVLGTIKPGEIREAARELGINKSAATRNRQYIIPARAVINYAASLGWCAKISVDNFPIKKPRRIAAERAWLDAFVARADVDALPHLAAAVMFMWQTGSRVSETARVLPEHVDLAKRVVLLEDTKTEEWAVRHITRELMIRIANLPQTEGEPLFGYASRFGIRDRMIAVCRRAKIQYVPPHQAGRHSYATHALDMGISIKEVMEGGGWKTARMLLENYAHAKGGGRAIADRLDQDRAQSGAEAPQVVEPKGRK